MRLLVAFLSAFSLAAAQNVTRVDANTPRDVQITIAKSAAPKEVADKADVYVLGRSGYELAVKGSNGFSCAVERERVDTMEPECYDREGSRTTFKARQFVEQQRAKGVSEQRIERAVAAGYKSGRSRRRRSRASFICLVQTTFSIRMQNRSSIFPDT